MEGSSDDHGEKKSVMKKVKDKAKKIKETLTKHDHHGTHNSDPDLGPDDDTAEGDSPEIHGAPVYESKVIRSTDLPMQLPTPEENPKTTLNVRKPVQRETPPQLHDPAPVSGLGEPGARALNARKPVLERETPSQLHDPAPVSGLGEPGTRALNARKPVLERETPQLHDPAPVSGLGEPGTRHHSNYEAKSLYPTTQQGGGEADLAQRVGHLNIEEDKHRWEMDTNTESHDQSSPQPIATEEPPKISYPRTTSEGGVSEKDSVPRHDTTQFQNPVSEIKDRIAPGTRVPSNYETKSVDPTGQGGKEAQVTSLGQRLDNLKVEEEDKHDRDMEPGSYKRDSHDQLTPEQKISEPRDDSTVGGVSDESTNTPLLQSYGYKVSEKLAPVYEKVVGTGTWGTDKTSTEGNAQSGGGVAASVKEYLADKLKPGDEDKAFSDSISEAVSKKKEQSLPVTEVTESPEVAARLGTGKEGKLEGADAVDAGKESSGVGFVDRLKDAATQWLGKTNPTDTAQEAVNKSHVSRGGETAD